MSETIVFEVETKRVLEILSKEIYDSPLALLRENLQNAYDAVLMRCSQESLPLTAGKIDVVLDGDKLIVRDSGIGMTEEVLRNNFWKAGSSGKRTELAKRSGVIGTFGIGAMANFGVATSLRVETRSIESSETLISIANRDSLSIARECIELYRSEDERGPGTEITVTLDPECLITTENARAYLVSYVQFLPVAVFLNGDLISQQSLEKHYASDTSIYHDLPERKVKNGIYRALVRPALNQAGNVMAKVSEIRLGEEDVSGELVLFQAGGQLMGLRNFFGLAPVPVSGHYQLGGLANLSILHPTAGREALSRESIQHVDTLVSMTEWAISESLSEDPAADRNQCFMNYILWKGRPELAGKVTVEVLPDNKSVSLERINEFCKGRKTHFFSGRDQSIIQTFSSEGSCLLNISGANPRRKVQLQYITNVLKIDEVPDKATVTKLYSGADLRMEEAAFLVRVASNLSDDYFLHNVEIRFAKISHGVNILVETKGELVVVSIARDSAPVLPLLECYRTAPDVFSDFIKDFVRNSLYDRLSKYIPSSTKEGADALRTILRRNRELYRYEESDLGELEPLLADYLAGDASLGDVIKKVRGSSRPQTQYVRSEQVGDIEEALPDVVESPTAEPHEGNEFEPAPAIMRPEVECDLKILTTTKQYGQLNNFGLFLGLSDRLFKREHEFFSTPHTTKVIWGGHRVIYIFGHASATFTLYYDIELREALSEHQASGSMIPTTTLITKNRIFVPVPEALVPEFKISEGAKEFYVRFDTVP